MSVQPALIYAILQEDRILKKYGVNELRRMYLEFFESKGHLAMKSFSLVPHNDNSLLLINAGMAPLKPYFTGQEIPPRKRVTTCQKCIRTGDIENVGKTGCEKLYHLRLLFRITKRILPSILSTIFSVFHPDKRKNPLYVLYQSNYYIVISDTLLPYRYKAILTQIHNIFHSYQSIPLP